MTHPNGYNPMRWDCEQRGCWNVKHRPNIEYFAHALPSKIGMTDLDGTVEVNGHFLFLEFKGYEPGPIPTGQRIYFERLTKLSKNITAVIVCGDAETMSITHTQVVHAGKFYPWQPCDLEGLFDRIKAWSDKVDIQVVSSKDEKAA